MQTENGEREKERRETHTEVDTRKERCARFVGRLHVVANNKTTPSLFHRSHKSRVTRSTQRTSFKTIST